MEWLLDSYAWMEYFGGNEKYRDYIEEGTGQTVSVSLTEVVRAFLRKRVERPESYVKFISSKSIIIPVEKEAAVRAGFLAERTGLHFSDAIIYAHASKNLKLVTGDPHFRGLENVEFVE